MLHWYCSILCYNLTYLCLSVVQQYVQHLLKENAETVVRQLIEDRGHIYVCGDISMAADVCRTLQSIFEENAAMSSEEARKLIESMKVHVYTWRQSCAARR